MDQCCLASQKTFLLRVCGVRPVLTTGLLTSGLVLTSTLNLFESVSSPITMTNVKSNQTRARMLGFDP